MLARAALAFFLTLAGELAYAHTAAEGVGYLFSGVLHPLTALEHVLPFVALSLLAGQSGLKAKAEAVLLVFPLALMLGATLALWIPAIKGVALFNVSSAIVLGLLVAVAWTLPASVFYAIAVICGLSHGFANGAVIGGNVNPWLFIPGIGLAGLAVLAYGMLMTDYILARKIGWMQIAVRVAGSWIAAIGVLVLATSAKTLIAS